MTQVVELLPTESKVQSSNPSTAPQPSYIYYHLLNI
jgi:hypothetical protein